MHWQAERVPSSREAVDLSVCVVAWNAAEDLSRCLPSLAEGAVGLSLEVIVVDNGSQDGTAELLANHPKARVIRNERNLGITPARNQAALAANGETIAMLDADTVAQPASLTTMVAYLRDHPNVGLVGPKLVDPDGTLQLSCRTISPPLLPFLRRPPLSRWFEHSPTVNRHLMRDFDHDRPRAVDWVMGACQCYPRRLLPEVGAYDERVFSHGGEDTDWCLRVWKAGYGVHYVPEAEVVHAYGHFTRKHPFSRQARRAITDFYYVLYKHRDIRGGLAER